MINAQAIKRLNLNAPQSVALGLFTDLYGRFQPEIKSLLEKNGQVFTGNPNIDLLQFIQLTKRKQFNQDLGNIVQKKYAPGFKNFDMSDFLSDTEEGFAGLGQSLSNNAGSLGGAGLGIFAPVLGGLANSVIPGSGGIVSGLSGIFGNLLSQPKPAATATPSQPLQKPLKTTFTNVQPYYNPAVKNALTMPPITPPATGLILGMAKKTFFIVLGSVVAVIAIIIVIIVMTRKHDEKKKDK